MQEALSYAFWHVLSTFDDINDQLEMFYSLLFDLLYAFALLHKVSSRRAKKPTPWLTDCIAIKIQEKIMLNELLLSQVVRGTRRSIANLKMKQKK